MKKKGIMLIVLGALGAILGYFWDIINRKPVNDLSGPISTPAFIICGLLIILGIYYLVKGPKK